MLRWLIAFAILLTCLPIHGQKESPKPKADQNISKAVEQKAPDPISISVVNSVDHQASQREGNSSENHSDSYLRHLFLPETIANFGMLIVGIVGTRIALRTLKNIERQTTSGETAANAAFQNAQAVVLSERARVVAKVHELDPRRFHIQGWNVGRVPAKITFIQGWHLVVPNGGTLPPEPPYLSVPPFNRDYIEWIPSGAFIDIFPDTNDYRLVADLTSDELFAAIKGAKRTLWVYGRICYEDGILPELRETRFCYEAVLDGERGIDLVMSGPAAYRLET